MSAWCLLQVHGYFAGLAMVVLVVIGLAAVVFFRRIDNSPRQAFVFAGLFLAFRPRHTCFWLVVFARKSLVAATVGHHAVVQAALLLAIAAVYLLLRPYNRMHAWLHRHLRHPVRRRPSTRPGRMHPRRRLLLVLGRLHLPEFFGFLSRFINVKPIARKE